MILVLAVLWCSHIFTHHWGQFLSLLGKLYSFSNWRNGLSITQHVCIIVCHLCGHARLGPYWRLPADFSCLRTSPDRAEGLELHLSNKYSATPLHDIIQCIVHTQTEVHALTPTLAAKSICRHGVLGCWSSPCISHLSLQWVYENLAATKYLVQMVTICQCCLPSTRAIFMMYINSKNAMDFFLRSFHTANPASKSLITSVWCGS